MSRARALTHAAMLPQRFALPPQVRRLLEQHPGVQALNARGVPLAADDLAASLPLLTCVALCVCVCVGGRACVRACVRAGRGP